MLYQYFTSSLAKRSGPNLHKGFGLEGFRNLSQECFSSGTASASNVSSDDSKGMEEVADVVGSSEAKIPLKLNSGSFYLPHPAKAETGGEDAHFICTLTPAIGVADVGGGLILVSMLDCLPATEAGLGPQMTAQRIAELAQQRAMDYTKSSPFSDGACEAGFDYHGGKLDDITVVVSYMTE